MREPRQILNEIDHTRHEMDETLREIEQRLTPRHMADQAMEYLKQSGAREYATNLGASIKTNPLPATLTGIGIAWLMAVGNRPAQNGGDGSSGLNLHERMESTKGRMSEMGDSARQQAERMRNGWNNVANEHPLALGAIGLAIGAVCAAMAPRTEKEEELIGKVKQATQPPEKRNEEPVSSATPLT